MGNGQSTEERKYAFQVLRVEAQSPAAAAHLVPYLDYITSVNGVSVVSTQRADSV